MKCLIVEDDFASRRILKEILSSHFDCDIAVNGQEAVHSFRLAHEGKQPYNLICMDIMMPVMDGNEALRQIREMERNMDIPFEMEVKVIMTTAMGDPRTVVKAYYNSGASAYIVKPLTRQKLMAEIRKLGILP